MFNVLKASNANAVYYHTIREKQRQRETQKEKMTENYFRNMILTFSILSTAWELERLLQGWHILTKTHTCKFSLHCLIQGRLFIRTNCLTVLSSVDRSMNILTFVSCDHLFLALTFQLYKQINTHIFPFAKTKCVVSFNQQANSSSQQATNWDIFYTHKKKK